MAIQKLKIVLLPAWLVRFKSKCGIPELEIVEEKLSVDHSAAKQFVKVFANGGEKL